MIKKLKNHEKKGIKKNKYGKKNPYNFD